MPRRHNSHAQPTASAAAAPNNANSQDTSHAATWFLQFAPFVYAPTASIRSNFDRLASQRNWGEKLRRKHWANCQAGTSVDPNNANTSSNAHTGTPNQAGRWFQQFRSFVYNPTTGLRSNFERLAVQRNWGDKLRRKHWAECQEEEFGHAYGTNTTKLEIWQNLCREVHIDNPPDSITQCRKVLGSRDVLVNLVNLIDHRNLGVEVIRFRSYNKFREYTWPDNIFPLQRAKKDGFIKALLREL